MRNLFKAAVATVMLAAASVLLSGCFVTDAYNAATGTTVRPNVILSAAYAFNTVETTASGYIEYCIPNPSPAGCNSTAVVQLIKAVGVGRQARDTAYQFLKDHPGELGSAGLKDAIVTATSQIKNIIATYGLPAGLTISKS